MEGTWLADIPLFCLRVDVCLVECKPGLQKMGLFISNFGRLFS